MLRRMAVNHAIEAGTTDTFPQSREALQRLHVLRPCLGQTCVGQNCVGGRDLHPWSACQLSGVPLREAE